MVIDIIEKLQFGYWYHWKTSIWLFVSEYHKYLLILWTGENPYENFVTPVFKFAEKRGLKCLEN